MARLKSEFKTDTTNEARKPQFSGKLVDPPGEEYLGRHSNYKPEFH